MTVVLSPTLVSDDYAPQTAGHASSPVPTAPLVTELLQLPVSGYGTVYRHISGMLTYHTVVPAVTKDIFVWIVGPRRSANYFNLLTYIFPRLVKNLGHFPACKWFGKANNMSATRLCNTVLSLSLSLSLPIMQKFLNDEWCRARYNNVDTAIKANGENWRWGAVWGTNQYLAHNR